MITLQEIAPYFGYELKARCDKPSYKQPEKDRIGIVTQMSEENNDVIISTGWGYYISPLDHTKLILRHLSDLTQEIEHNGKKFVPSHVLANTKSTKTGYIWNYYKIDNDNVRILNYEIIKKLFEWHFDVFGLIERGDAIDINTLPK